MKKIYRNISEFSYRYGDNARASILASFQAKGPDDGAGVMQALRDDGCTVMDLSGNELAKAHARHLVGGRSPNAADELLYRFEFPERRGGTQALSMMTTKAAALGTITIASHQVLVGVLTVAQFCPEPLSQAAQTFLANTAGALRKGAVSDGLGGPETIPSSQVLRRSK